MATAPCSRLAETRLQLASRNATIKAKCLLNRLSTSRPIRDFPIQNLPFGIFKPRDGNARVGVAIGDLILDLSVLEERGFFSDVVAAAVPAAETEICRRGRRQLPRCLRAIRSMPSWRWVARHGKKRATILQNLLSAETADLARQRRIARARISQTKRRNDATSRAHRRLH